MGVAQVFRVIAKKIVSWLRFSLSWSTFFSRVLEQNFVPHLSQHLECEATKLHGYKMADAVHFKHVLKTRFYSSYFTRHSGINTHGSQEFVSNWLFTCSQFNAVQKCAIVHA